MYKCDVIDKFIEYKLSFNYKCPSELDIFISSLFSNIFLILDPLIFAIPLIWESHSINDLSHLLYRNTNNNNLNINNNSIETSHTSKADDEISSNNSQSFEKKSTTTIIIDNEINTNDDNIKTLTINKNIKENNKQKILLNKKESEKNIIEEDKSKSGSGLIIHNKNIFKIFNQKIK